MPYHVYVPWMTKFLSARPNPKILEIGVDVGQTLIPITHNLILTGRPFKYVGLDIRADVNLEAMLRGFMIHGEQVIEYRKENSLKWLPECKEKFDMVLIDGDHNYQTVFTELSYIDSILAPNGVVICDDYVGKWSERDLYYSTRETHDGIDIATEAIEGGPQGVKTAVDDWLKENPAWKSTSVIHSEAVMLIRRETAMQLGL